MTSDVPMMIILALTSSVLIDTSLHLRRTATDASSKARSVILLLFSVATGAPSITLALNALQPHLN